MELLFLSDFGKAFIPKAMRPHIRLFFEKAGKEEVPYHLFGILFWVTAAITYLIYISRVYPLLKGKAMASFFLLTFIGWTALMLGLIVMIGGVAYFYLTMVIYNRTKEMESRLPEYLTLVSTGLKGGYAFEKALWGALKPEFGVLAKEIGLVSKKVMTGNDITDALEEFSRKYDSPLLRRSIDLIVSELESGGKVADVIDRVIFDLKKTRALKEEMAASTVTYMIFISALVMFIMPVLFALSFILYNIISGFIGDIATSMSSSPIAAFSISKPAIDPGDYKVFAVLAITVIAGSSALIVSIIEKGDIRGGLKYIPMFVLTSVFLYFLFLRILQGLFGSIVGG